MNILKCKSHFRKTSSSLGYISQDCIFVYSDNLWNNYIIFKYEESNGQINTYIMNANNRELKPTRISNEKALNLLLDKTNRMLKTGDYSIKQRVINRMRSVKKPTNILSI
jgi:hypothetical protein